MADVFSNVFSSGQWGLQSPAMLFALLSLVVPIVIHLFSKSRGQVIPIGDIRLIAVKKLKRMTEVRLVERLLLALRALLLVLISLLLAQLFLNDSAHTNGKDFIFVTQDWLNFADTEEKQQLVSQIDQADNSVLLLSKTNEQPVPLTIEKVNSDQNLANEQSPYLNVWQEVKSTKASLAADSQVIVYSTDRLSQFIGYKPQELSQVEWRIKSTVVDDTAIPLSTPIKVLVLHDRSRRKDVTYIRAAFTALSEYKLTGLDITYREITTEPESERSDTVYDDVDVLFYLADKPLSPGLLNAVEAGMRLIVDASTKRQSVETLVKSHPYQNRTSLPVLNSDFALHQVGVPQVVVSSTPESVTQVIWKTESGAALLIANKVGEGEVYSFYSRFSPDWSNWVLNTLFPYDIASLIIGGVVGADLEKAMLSQLRLTKEQISLKGQLLQHASENNNKPHYADTGTFPDKKSPPFFFIFFITVVFCIERLLSEFTIKQNPSDNKNLSEQVEDVS